MYFKDIIGQDTLKEHLIKSANKGIVAHAQLFAGQMGYGTFALALAYARYLNCTQRTEHDACGSCPSCIKYDALAHPDLHFVFPVIKSDVSDSYIDQWRSLLSQHPYFSLRTWMDTIEAGNTQPLIYVKESDAIIKKMTMRIYEAEYRILIVWMPERMNTSCANKLLKFIEEPPAKTVILLVSETPEQIIGTILSRSQLLHIPPIESHPLEQTMTEQYGLIADDARHVAHLSNGDMLKAIETISVNEENMFFLEQFKGMMRNSWARNVKGMKSMAEEMAAIGRERQKAFLSYCQHLIRENFIYNLQTTELNYMNREETQFSTKFAPFVNERNIIDLMQEITIAEQHITQNTNAKMVFFDLYMRLTVLLKR